VVATGNGGETGPYADRALVDVTAEATSGCAAADFASWGFPSHFTTAIGVSPRIGQGECEHRARYGRGVTCRFLLPLTEFPRWDPKLTLPRREANLR